MNYLWCGEKHQTFYWLHCSLNFARFYFQAYEAPGKLYSITQKEKSPVNNFQLFSRPYLLVRKRNTHEHCQLWSHCGSAVAIFFHQDSRGYLMHSLEGDKCSRASKVACCFFIILPFLPFSSQRELKDVLVRKMKFYYYNFMTKFPFCWID